MQVQIPKVHKGVLHTDFIAEKQNKRREENGGKWRIGREAMRMKEKMEKESEFHCCN